MTFGVDSTSLNEKSNCSLLNAVLITTHRDIYNALESQSIGKYDFYRTLHILDLLVSKVRDEECPRWSEARRS